MMTRKEMWERHAAIGAAGLTREAKDAAYAALHREYFGSIVAAFNIKAPAHLKDACRAALDAGDTHMCSTTRLSDWDRREPFTARIPGLRKALRESGEGWSLSTNLCLLKEAMRREIESEGA